MSNEEIDKINEADISLQDQVRRDPTSCDHIGFHTPLGHEVFPESISSGAFKIVASTLCMMCGSVRHHISELLEDKATKQ